MLGVFAFLQKYLHDFIIVRIREVFDYLLIGWALLCIGMLEQRKGYVEAGCEILNELFSILFADL